MAIAFRLREDSFGPRKVAYFGVKCPHSEEPDVRAVLEPIDLSWCRSLAGNLSSRRDPDNEFYLADLGEWPADMLAYGIERLRAELTAAGWQDASEHEAA